MPQEIKVLLAGIAALALVVTAASLLVLMDPRPSWTAIVTVPLMLTLAVFLPAELPEEEPVA